MASFKDFKAAQEKTKKALQNMKPDKPNYGDPRQWNFTKDKAGNANATLRFLPQQDPTKSPIILTFTHGFQTKGKWFIEDCPHTVGNDCPVCEYASSVWDSNEDEGRKHWRRKIYIANVLIVKDEGNPENEGKVKLFKFGQKIYNKIMGVVAPEDEDETPINVFDFDNGLDFKLKLTQKGGFNNYDNSKFVMGATAVADGDEGMQEAIYNQIVNLDEFVDPKKFKSYENLKKKFDSLQGVGGAVPSAADDIAKENKKAAHVSSQTPAKEPTSNKEEEEDDLGDIDFDALLNGDD